MSTLLRRLTVTSLGIIPVVALGACVASVGYGGDIGIGYSPG